MTWKPWMTWSVCLPVWAVMAYLSSDHWVARVTVFIVLVSSILLWLRRQLRKNAS